MAAGFELMLLKPTLEPHPQPILLTPPELDSSSHGLVDWLRLPPETGGREQAVTATQCASSIAARVLSPAKVGEFLTTGMCVVDDVLSASGVRAARRELEAVHAKGELQSVEFQKVSKVRNDLVGWLDSSRLAKTPALAPVVALLRGLPAEIARHGGPPMAVPPMVQAALYDGSPERPSFYHRHLDCSDPLTNPRRLTAILYLNPRWDPRDGGCLRAHPLGDRGVVDIEPVGGRLLMFNSCEVEHEVLPSLAPRMAVTLWAFAP